MDSVFSETYAAQDIRSLPSRQLRNYSRTRKLETAHPGIDTPFTAE